jgi:hypothetical protein
VMAVIFTLHAVHNAELCRSSTGASRYLYVTRVTRRGAVYTRRRPAEGAPSCSGGLPCPYSAFRTQDVRTQDASATG